LYHFGFEALVVDKDKIAVYISKDLYNLMKHRVDESGGEFKSVEDYVGFVLKEVVKEEEVEEQKYTKEEEEQIKKRLRSLGYL
jgi:hypothetical protein